MSITTRDARAQLAVMAKTVADAFDLKVEQASILQEQFTESGVYLLATAINSTRQRDAKLQTISGSTITFFLRIVVHEGDFTGPESDMPYNLDDIADRVITEIQALNTANQTDTSKIRVSITDNFHDYDFGQQQGMADFILEIPYTHVGN